MGLNLNEHWARTLISASALIMVKPHIKQNNFLIYENNKTMGIRFKYIS